MWWRNLDRPRLDSPAAGTHPNGSLDKGTEKRSVWSVTSGFFAHGSARDHPDISRYIQIIMNISENHPSVGHVWYMDDPEHCLWKSGSSMIHLQNCHSVIGTWCLTMRFWALHLDFQTSSAKMSRICLMGRSSTIDFFWSLSQWHSCFSSRDAPKVESVVGRIWVQPLAPLATRSETVIWHYRGMGILRI